MADDRHGVDSVDAPDLEPSEQAGPTEEKLARGRASSTPFLLLGSVAATIWGVLALVAGAVLLVWWLA
jgi:hypothetical protein